MTARAFVAPIAVLLAGGPALAPSDAVAPPQADAPGQADGHAHGGSVIINDAHARFFEPGAPRAMSVSVR